MKMEDVVFVKIGGVVFVNMGGVVFVKKSAISIYLARRNHVDLCIASKQKPIFYDIYWIGVTLQFLQCWVFLLEPTFPGTGTHLIGCNLIGQA